MRPDLIGMLTPSSDDDDGFRPRPEPSHVNTLTADLTL
jgi:hypothetical protein